MSAGTNHTRGPLKVLVAFNGDCGLVSQETNSMGRPSLVAECYADIRRPGENARAEAIANARLYAEAPAMYEVLHALIHRADESPDIVQATIDAAAEILRRLAK